MVSLLQNALIWIQNLIIDANSIKQVFQMDVYKRISEFYATEIENADAQQEAADLLLLLCKYATEPIRIA